MTENTRIVDRVRAMLAKAEATNFPEEAELFAQKAHELIAQHMLTEADLSGGPATARTFGRRTMWLEQNGYVLVRRHLLSLICAAYGATFAYQAEIWRQGRYWTSIDLFARDDYLLAVEVLFQTLDAQALRLMKAQRGMRDRRSWYAGFAQTVGERLATVNRQADDESDGALLPLLCSDLDGATEAMQAELGRLRTVRSRAAPLDPWAAEDGRAAGRHADIGEERISGPQPNAALGSGS
ncbi:MAG: DUF2786 domain-containing protein [Actinomycetia bacterium]|nr:DUF2786 domain-containing protein [Actinomycetes bacterium]